jgi:hypothetical protein
MHTVRHRNASPTANLSTLLAILQQPTTRRLTLYAMPHGSGSPHNGGRLPTLAAIADIETPQHSLVRVVFDQELLVASQGARGNALRALLDAAQESGKTECALGAAPMTSTLSPRIAIAALGAVGPRCALTAESRARFVALLAQGRSALDA